MEKPLYLEDNYMKEFDATVKEANGKFIVLDNTAFYPNSGGQPHDTGKFIKDGEEYNVIFTGKFSGNISHEVDKEGLKAGDKIKGVIDWERRYKLMRYHTAAHVVSAMIHNKTGALITGNQKSEEKARIDFSLEEFDREALLKDAEEANKYLGEDIEVKKYFMSKEDVMKDPSLIKLKDKMPPDVEEFRIIEIADIDKQPCGGTHVDNLKEIPKIKATKAENKGKQNRRVYFEFD
ncbi:alanyl-tRNA editing protein [Candidatus Woesearchaeota archaeon]|nr:alanyl-tRNA editing protein [Candidatus Woesearchaeota archaeon]